MKNLIGVLFLLLVSCGVKPKKEEALLSENNLVETEVEPIEKQKNVISPENWSDFDTDIEMVILFYKGDSLSKLERRIVDGLKKEFPTLNFHEFYSDDNLAQVFLNDTLVFDLSHYMSEKSYGFVLLKPDFPPYYEFLDDSLSTLKENFHEFYGNK